MIMFMIMSLTWQVYADDASPDDQETAVHTETVQTETPKAEAVKSEPAAEEVPAASEQAKQEVVEAPETPEATAPTEQETVESPAATEPAEAVDEVIEAEVVPEAAETADDADPVRPVTKSSPAVLSAASAKDTAEGDAAKADVEKNITVAGTKLDLSGDASGDGWTYEKESGRIVLRDYTGSADITSDGTGVEIVSTGFNRIGTLSCDGDINVIGAGILLIDKVELAEDASFNLLPLQEYYGDDGGSVAVFLKQEDGSYLLANGTVKGIIDEKLDLPEDIKLVLPAKSVLELQALVVKVETDEDGNKTIIRDISGYSLEDLFYNSECEFYGGHLWIGDLTLEEGATIQNNSFQEAIVASINVAGNLVNNGLIKGGAVTVVDYYSGTGTIEDAHITLKTGQTMSINIKDSILDLAEGEYTIEELGLTGLSEIYYGGNFEIKNINGSSDSKLYIYSFDMRDTLKLTGVIDKTAVLIKSGITELSEGLKLKNNGKVNNIYVDNENRKINYGGPVFNYGSITTVSDGKDGPVFFGPKDISVPDPDSIPVVSFTLHKTIDHCWNITLEENYETGQEYTILENYDASHSDNGLITYRDLMSTYFPDGVSFDEQGESIIFEVFSLDDKNRLHMHVLGEDSDLYEWDTPSDGVFLIRLADLKPWQNSHGGSSGTSTRANQTGSGNIGGNSSSIFKGTGITRLSSVDPVDPDPVDPDPVDPDPVDPDPVKPDPVKPDPKPEPDPNPVKPDPEKPDPVDPDPKPDPDPDKPTKEYSIAAVTAVGDTLALQINEFDLNEGNENAEKAPYYNLTAYVNGAQISELSGPVDVEMNYVLPEEFKDKSLYAVFANEDEASDETLAAIRTEYDEEAGTLTFETSQLGEFIITAFEFDGEEFSPEFYDELEKLDIVKLFIEHLKEKKDNAGL